MGDEDRLGGFVDRHGRNRTLAGMDVGDMAYLPNRAEPGTPAHESALAVTGEPGRGRIDHGRMGGGGPGFVGQVRLPGRRPSAGDIGESHGAAETHSLSPFG